MADVLISYSRQDVLFVRRLALALQSRGKSVFVDLAEVWRAEDRAHHGTELGGAEGATGRDEREQSELSGILPSARWMDEIRAAISEADAVVVAISPDFARSSVCAAELEHAVSLHKRVVPVVVRETPPGLLPQEVRELNWLPFGSEATFESDVDKLVEVLDIDLERVHLHTRLLLRCAEWQNHSRDRSLLLRGRELADAEQWLTGQASRKPAPTALQGELVLASRRAALRRQRGSMSVALVLAVAFMALGIIALVQRNEAVDESHVALSGELATESFNLMHSDVPLQLLFSLESYRVSPTSAAASAIVDALEEPLQGVLYNRSNASAVAYSPNGEIIATGGPRATSCSGTPSQVTRSAPPYQVGAA